MTDNEGVNVPPKPVDRFRRQYLELSDGEKSRIASLKIVAHDLERMIEEYVPNGREKSLAFTHLEDCVMRAVRGISE